MPAHKTVLIGEGGEYDNKSIPLGTRKRTRINNLLRDEWSQDQLGDALKRCKEDFPNAIQRSITATYNCVGMVFASRRTWVEPEHVTTFLHDDEYVLLASLQEAQIGDIVIYKNTSGEIKHVGIVASRIENLEDATISFKVLSKWGPWAEFIHDPEDIYEAWGRITEVWTDRKQI